MSKAMATTDHAIVNLPLSKRGNIDRDIDKLKAQSAARSKQRMRELREAQRAVKQLNRVLVDITWGDPVGALKLAKRMGDVVAAYQTESRGKLCCK